MRLTQAPEIGNYWSSGDQCLQVPVSLTAQNVSDSVLNPDVTDRCEVENIKNIDMVCFMVSYQ